MGTIREQKRAARIEKLALLGPKPPFWRPFARLRWVRAFNSIMTITVGEWVELLEDFSPRAKALAVKKRPGLKLVDKDK